jgi:hypothetical protein
VHYKNGETVVEDRTDSYFWDKLPNKENIIAMGILYDALVLDEKDKDGKRLRLTNIPQSLVLKGSNRHNYRFFQFKTVDFHVGKIHGKKEINLTIGMITDKEGHCIIMEALPDVNIKTYYTTVHSLRLNLELFDIKLEEII